MEHRESTTKEAGSEIAPARDDGEVRQILVMSQAADAQPDPSEAIMLTKIHRQKSLVSQSFTDRAIEKIQHDPQHSEGPTWCKRCGTFDDHFQGTPCRHVPENAAWWRVTGVAE